MINDYVVEIVYSRMRSDRKLLEMTAGGRHPLIRGIGKRNTGVMIINSTPTSADVTMACALAGPNGAVLHDLMGSAGLWCTDGCEPQSTNCWYTYACKWRRGSRPHTDEEIKAYRPWLLLEWKALGRPHTIITIGSAATKAVVGVKNYRPILSQSGHPDMYGEFDVWPMIDPAYAIKYPQLQPQIEKDWERLGAWLKSK